MTNNKIKINMDSLQARRDWKRHKVKDGNNHYRILPPFGESSNGYPYRKWQIIWGLKDPTSGRLRPYASSMTSEKKCPVTEFVTELKAKAETIKSEMVAEGATEEQIKDRLTVLSKTINDLSPKTVYIYNAVDRTGEVGLLELKSTAHKKMKTEMSQYISDYQQDPTSLNSEEDDSGIWFNVSRAGLGRNTEYDVSKCQRSYKNDKGRLVFEDDRSELPEQVKNEYDRLAYDLSAVYKNNTYEELADILAANMADILESCPDIGEDVVVENATPLKGNKAVNLKLGADTETDNDDISDLGIAPSKSALQSRSAPTTLDQDDFMAQADAILNS